MRSSRNYKLSKKTKLLAAAGITAAYILGFAVQAYSPAHIGHYAIPLPVLITPSRTFSVGNDNPSQTAVLSQASGPLSSQMAQVESNGSPAFFSHKGIITTYFWVGEPGDKDNGYIANMASAWDGQWQAHYGGVDAPTPRNGYYPAAFTPKENPFYFALPYNDIDSKGRRKATAVNCPHAAANSGYSWCKNSWIGIRANGKVAYAQWEDVGPFNEDDNNYVFGSSPPKNKRDAKAGLDVSPAVKAYLGLADVSPTDWVFIKGPDVPPGPWTVIVSSDPGDPL